MNTFLISEATKKNWDKLNLSSSEISKKLISRANKTNSDKNIIPLEYFQNKSNIDIVKNILKISNNIDDVIYNIALNILKKEGIIEIKNSKIKSDNEFVLQILNDYPNKKQIEEILSVTLPPKEDILGIIYQILMSEGDKNKKGSYYTPKSIIKYMLNDLKKEYTYLDPCCGAGNYLLCAAEKINNPENIYGFDIDYIACFISKINLIVKFKNKKFYPNIYNIDFLSEEASDKLNGKQFDYISTNPPWGAKYKNLKQNKNNSVKESYARFILKSETFLKSNGSCSFLLPESILNVKTHKCLRKFILDNFIIDEIKIWGKIFNGVLTDVISIKLDKNFKKEPTKIIINNTTKKINQNAFSQNKNKNFMIIDNKDFDIITKIYNYPHTTLSKSKWGLGIVTGNNSKYIKTDLKNTSGFEPIYTGKEIKKYILENTDKYIHYDRTLFQQTAPDNIYRAKEKLVYKFISNQLSFAYDNKKRLFLNSANILIPNVETHSTLTVMAYLNSKLFQYIYKCMFGEIKILRGNLEQLPFPYIDEKTKNTLEDLVNMYLSNNNIELLEQIDEIVFKSFNIESSSILIPAD